MVVVLLEPQRFSLRRQKCGMRHRNPVALRVVIAGARQKTVRSNKLWQNAEKMSAYEIIFVSPSNLASSTHVKCSLGRLASILSSEMSDKFGDLAFCSRNAAKKRMSFGRPRKECRTTWHSGTNSCVSLELVYKIQVPSNRSRLGSIIPRLKKQAKAWFVQKQQIACEKKRRCRVSSTLRRTGGDQVALTNRDLPATLSGGSRCVESCQQRGNASKQEALLSPNPRVSVGYKQASICSFLPTDFGLTRSDGCNLSADEKPCWVFRWLPATSVSIASSFPLTMQAGNDTDIEIQIVFFLKTVRSSACLAEKSGRLRVWHVIFLRQIISWPLSMTIRTREGRRCNLLLDWHRTSEFVPSWSCFAADTYFSGLQPSCDFWDGNLFVGFYDPTCLEVRSFKATKRFILSVLTDISLELKKKDRHQEAAQ